MLVRLRSTLFAWGGAMVLAVSATGLVAAASLVGDVAPTSDTTEQQPAATDTTLTFEDSNGDGSDDDCQDAVTADQSAADVAVQAADTNGDGTISVSEAAHTDWTGGPNCNHGGYVSSVAGASGEDEETDAADEQQPATCETTPEAPTTEAPTIEEETPTDTAPNAHGKAVSAVAQDEAAVGGKNCNHGGAVSEAAKKDHGGGPNVNATKNAKTKGHRWGHGRP